MLRCQGTEGIALPPFYFSVLRKHAYQSPDDSAISFELALAILGFSHDAATSAKYYFISSKGAAGSGYANTNTWNDASTTVLLIFAACQPVPPACQQE